MAWRRPGNSRWGNSVVQQPGRQADAHTRPQPERQGEQARVQGCAVAQGPTPPASPVRLAAVVVTHNRLEQLRITLGRLLESPPAHLAAVVVVDNASDDGTAGWLAAQDDARLIVARLAENRGGAGGFAHGMELALARTQAGWLVVMDDDARPEPGALSKFHARDLRGWDAVAAAAYHPDGRICEMNRPTLNPFAHPKVFVRTLMGGGRGAFHLGPADYAHPGPLLVDGASFAGLFVSRAAVARAGLPRAELFLYGDDAIWTLELSRAGGRIGFFPAIRFEHDSATLGAGDGRFRPLWKVYYYHRNLLILYRLAAGWAFWPVLMVVLPRWLLRVRAHRGERRAFLGLLARAVRDGLTRRLGAGHARVLDWSRPAPPRGRRPRP